MCRRTGCHLLSGEHAPDDPACHDSSKEASGNITGCLWVGMLLKRISRPILLRGAESTYPMAEQIGHDLR
jgi:hypothetical protein